MTAIAFDRGGTNDLYTSSGLADVTQVIGWNLYHGWYYETFEDFGKFLDEQHRKFPGRSLIVSEYGANADTSVHSLAPKRFDSSIEWQQMYHESYLAQIESRPFVAGGAIWNQFDFASEFRGETMPHINQKGMYRYDRRPKDVSFLYRASYSRAPVVHIAVRDWLKRSGPRTQPVKVYTNVERIELFHNGISLGTKAIGPERNGSWQITFAVGRNVLRSVGRSGAKTISDQIVVDFHDQASTTTIAVNCGANTEVIDDVGIVWQADTAATGARSWSVVAPDSKAVDTRVNILGTSDDAIYQTMREGESTYKFDVPDGRYEVELRFAEPRLKATGERVFDITFNGLPFSERVDVFAEAGYMTGLTRRTTQSAAGGRGIRIEFVAIKNLPIVSGIRLKKIN